MKIISLHVENFKTIRMLDITPKDDMVVISGKNSQGKSSVMDAFVATLAGADALKNTPEPIRKGEERAEVKVNLGDYTVTRVWTQKGSTVTIESNGAIYKRPQEMLDAIIGKLTFDPLEFSRMAPKEQYDVLTGIVKIPLDLDKWQQEYDAKYEERKLLGHDVKNLQGQLALIPEFTEEQLAAIPEDELVVTELVSKLEQAKDYNAGLEAAQNKVAHQKNLISSLESQLKLAKEGLLVAEDELKTYGNGMKKDTAAIEREIESSDEINKRVRIVKQRADAVAKLNEKSEQHKAAGAELEAMMESKKKVLEEVKMPIAGLGLNDGLVTYNGQPFSQISTSEQIKVSTAIAMVANPKLRVIRIADGSLLDEESMEMIKQMAKEEDFQIWVEVVDGSGKVGIYLEEGEIVSKSSLPHAQ